jgi:histidyl-tRNA synthetase
VSRFRAPTGTHDILPAEQPAWAHVRKTFTRLCRRYGYQEITTPILEDTGVFLRTVGAGTDIVDKEMYTFLDKGGDSLTLRPEGTAPVVRAYLEHGMYNLPQPVRLHYFGPIFRYDRPQAGRYRQHFQLGCELLGDADAAADAEVIHLLWTFYVELGLRNLSLQLNSIGDQACRPRYVEALQAYYRGRVEEVCPTCRQRMERNPLRLLDCKETRCQPVIAAAPRSIDYLCEPCREHFEALQHYLRALEVPWQLNPRLVRGLDYYTRTVFEVWPPEVGAQSTLGAGGRYDGLAEALGGRPTPGVGFATGVERILLNLRQQGVLLPEPAPLDVFVAYLGQAAKERALQLAMELRRQGLSVSYAPSPRSMKAQLRLADAWRARYTVILGEDELDRGVVTLRDMARSEQSTVPQAELAAALAGR